MKKTLYEKIWESHIVYEKKGDASILYVDRHLVHEVTSPQAFEGLRLNQRPVRRVQSILATMDHSIPTRNRDQSIADPIARKQVDTLSENCKRNNIILYDLHHDNQGIVHVIAPELGFVQPGMIIVCGDSHTSTHGAFGALAFGIGTSEVEHVMATQTLQQDKAKSMLVKFRGCLSKNVSSKDMILALIGKIGTAGGTGYVMEYSGEAIGNLSMEERMTLCNMSIEAGAKAGLIAPDKKTIEYIKGRRFAPQKEYWDKAVSYWESLYTDEGAIYDQTITIDCSQLEPQVTWGSSPGQVTGITQRIPSPEDFSNPDDKQAYERALAYMGLEPGMLIEDIQIDYVFIGSCTNSRIEDLRIAAKVVQGKTMHAHVKGIVVPGSGMVKRQAEQEGLHKIFLEAGFEWREPGCSMCLGMNDDLLQPGQRCAATSNRNFEGRQGKGGRTHLVSPAMAALAAIEGRFVDVRNWN